MSSLYPIFFTLSAVAYLALGTWVILREKEKMQQLYGLLCLTTCCWQAIWASLLSDPQMRFIDVVLKVGFTGVVFVPSILYHFTCEFTGQEKSRLWLKGIYLVSTLLATTVWIGRFFTNGTILYSWGVSAKAGPLYPIFTVLVFAVIVRMLVLLNRFEVDIRTHKSKKRQILLVKVATYIYMGGAIDLVSQYGISVFPLSFLFIGASVILYGYAMFKYQFLKIAPPQETEDELARRKIASYAMRHIGMSAAFPLVSQGELLGYLLLGEKSSKESYNAEDLLLLRIVVNQAALAYQRVRYLEMAVHGARTEMLGEIAGSFAHEIKTPLANISLPAELSLMDIKELEAGIRKPEEILPELKKRLEDIMHQTVKASEKIEAVRQFSKPGPVEMEPVDLSDILRNSLSLLNHQLTKNNTKVCADFPNVLAPVRGDAKQLEIVFVNLIKNASEAMAQHSSAGLARELLIKAHEDGNWIVASVKDTGPGIKRTDFGQLFEAYFTTKGSEGTGMGLFLSRQVIKAHGGQIDVESDEGKGTEFIIRLPKYMNQNQSRVQAA